MTDSKQAEQDFIDTYNIHDFDVPLTCVDMALFSIIDWQLHVLLVKRAQFPAKGQWALPGGFIDLKQDQTLEDTARRKLHEKTGIDTAYLEQVMTVGNQKRDPRGWSVTVVYYALLDASELNAVNHPAVEEVRWVPIADITEHYTLAFDHALILQQCKERLKAKVHYTSVPIHLMSAEFTLSELQKVYEILMDMPIEKKSFRRRLLEADIIEATGEEKITGRRPAQLYRLKPSNQPREAHYFPRGLEGKRG